METNYLIALNINEYEVAKYERRKVNKYGFVDIDTNKYSIGTKFQFQVIADCYERKSLIITTDLEFGKWNSIFLDKKLIAAIID